MTNLFNVFLLTLFTYYNGTVNGEKISKIKNVVHPKIDSSITEKFIASVLEEYEKEGRWVYVKMIRCNDQSSYEIVEPMSLYKALSEGTSMLDKKMFISMALQNLYVHKAFANCPEEAKAYIPNASYEIKGRKINMNRYNYLKSIPFNKLLKTYFNNKQVLLIKYKKSLNELIAICYENNVKVIAPIKGKIRYESFR